MLDHVSVRIGNKDFHRVVLEEQEVGIAFTY